MRVLLTGAGGQLGQALQKSAPPFVQLIPLTSQACDISNIDMVHQAVNEHKPAVIINTAAYTAVDQAETEQERAFAVNRTGAKNVATISQEQHLRLIHFSTDYVFDGKNHQPYQPFDACDPQSVYGKSKWAGEQAVLTTLPHALIIRTSWLYGMTGHNFVKTMLRLMREKEHVRVIWDQIGTPTWTGTLTDAVWRALGVPALHGILHCADAGIASWYDFAVAIQEEALAYHLLSKAVPVIPIRSHEYQAQAPRPLYSVLDTAATWRALAMAPRPWRASLRLMLQELTHV